MNRWLRPLGAGFRSGVKFREQAYRRGWLKSNRLGCPVISVGNLSVGGTGKTPIVILAAELLMASGITPAILTRGYGRRRGGMIAIKPEPDRSPDPRQVGDEPALIARRLSQAPMVISSNRFRAGKKAEELFRVGAHILDDGFQHLALARDLDIVLIDVTRELSDGAVLPAGLLREPLAALGRAHAVILTRVEQADAASVERLVRQSNRSVPIFHSSIKLAGLVEVRSGRAYPAAAIKDEPVLGFCAIGNPTNFFASLRHWNFRVSGEKTFRDHHVYSEGDLTLLSQMARASKAVACLTTEKDVMNLPLTAGASSGVPILSCVIQAEVSEAAEFEKLLLTAVLGRRVSL